MDQPRKDLKEIITDIISSHEIADTVTIAFNSVAIRVKTNSVPLANELRSYFREFIGGNEITAVEIHAFQGEPPALPFQYIPKEPDPGKTRIKEEYINFDSGRAVRKRLTGMVFLFQGPLNLAVGPCMENVNQVVNFINNRFIQIMLDRDCLLLHAAGVMIRESGIALCGFAGAGKSTLALHLMGRGANFVSNDRLLARREDDGIAMYGVAKYPRINPGTILSIREISGIITEENRARYDSLSPEELWTLEEKYDLYIDDAYGRERFMIRAPMKALIILNWKRNGGGTGIREISPRERTDLFPAFMKSPGLFFIPGTGTEPDMSESRYADLVERCRVIEVSGGIDFEAVVEYCYGQYDK